jgi:YHS domain-containing protein
MKRWIIIGLGVLVLSIGSFMSVKKVSPLSWGWWGTYNTSSELALQGYDPVSYLSDNQPMPGTAEYSFNWGDATWQFASANNLALFEQNPAQYAPQFGGFCAFAASKGFTADISTDAWHVEAGKLYVFADQNVRDEWVATLGEGSLEASNANWAKR